MAPSMISIVGKYMLHTSKLNAASIRPMLPRERACSITPRSLWVSLQHRSRSLEPIPHKSLKTLKDRQTSCTEYLHKK